MLKTIKSIRTAIIKNEIFQINFCADMTKFCTDSPCVTEMYGLEKQGITYVLAILEDRSYRLYSKKQKKLYVKGKISDIRWCQEVSKLIH